MCHAACHCVPAEPEVTVPFWFHTGGMRMEVNEEESNQNELVLSSAGVAKLKITRVADEKYPEQFRVEWCLVHNPMEESCGTILLMQDILLAAFGLLEMEMPLCGRSFIRRYCADFAVQGRCVRQGSYLNIPGPGTGLAGDANLSIYVTPEVQQAVRSFVFPRN